MSRKRRGMDKEKEIEQLEKDLIDKLVYDEWSGREYAQTEVDFHDTAANLIELGYRKADEVRKEQWEKLRKLSSDIISDLPVATDRQVIYMFIGKLLNKLDEEVD